MGLSLNLESSSPESFSLNSYNGIFPCFLLGNTSALFSNILKALINFERVSSGRITSSTKPLSAALYGLANFSAYSASFSNHFSSGFSAVAISLFEDDFSSSFRSHYRNFRGRPCKYHICSNVF